ncbi:MAG: 4-hydroxybenzoate 3-monooxygenase [Microbacteriaceae bacterium]|jgi:2-polyprenyl-6-methoxyphenol hydroxylase-like FAD-dependent oxidoreductase|nr:4-hydroxybenzoate 3-monooxygenase [Microbacteriaceae bacterium]
MSEEMTAGSSSIALSMPLGEGSRGTSVSEQTTRVAIIGAGPAGLLLSWALRDAGIDAMVVENRSQDYVLARIRAGILEQGSVETLTRLGLGDRIASEGMVHNGIYLQAAGQRHNVNFNELIGRTVTVRWPTSTSRMPLAASGCPPCVRLR